MRRREVLAGAAVLAGATLARHSAAQNVTAKVTAQALVDSPWDKHWDEFKATIAAHPDITVEYYLRGETGSEEQMLTALRRNRVQIGGITMWGLAGIIPEAAVPMMPYLFDTTEEVDFVFDDFLEQRFDAFLNEKGLKFLHWSEVGWNNLYTKKPVLIPADIKGMKIRGSPNYAAQAFLMAVGANPVALGIADIAPALQTGLVDGGLSSLTFFYYGLKSFATDLTALHQCYDQGVQVANLDWWNSLTPAQQTAFRTAFVPIERARRDLRAHGAEIERNLRTEGLKIHALSPDQRAQWVAAARPTHGAILKEIGGKAQNVYDLIQDGKRAFAQRG
ncbi:MAG: TRAP transporter substrate-binding protein DctP [Rhodospirillaceae bacterium]|nr:TRAP transporter substrate-binding protein DctP [Rhodospirillaceae bacterium]